MGNRVKPGTRGAARVFIKREQALKKLQLNIVDFRRLCILKGIYPRVPTNFKHLKKNGLYYHLKDIKFLSHEPLLRKFRELKAFSKKIVRALGKGNKESAKRLRKNTPIYSLDHLIKERYPTFVDALRDLDDPLCLIFLFRIMQQNKSLDSSMISQCDKLAKEFMNYVIASNSLRKVFISIKGIYFQVEIMGQSIIWIVPLSFCQNVPEDVDLGVMAIFLEFYTTTIGFVNFHLYSSLGYEYPPSVDLKIEEETTSLTAYRLEQLNYNKDEQSVDNLNELNELVPTKLSYSSLFQNCRFYLSAEIPKETFQFIILSCGGEVSWKNFLYDEDDPTITHQIVDKETKNIHSRYYLQPQWIADCVNSQKLLPVEDYFEGKVLPPHFSPFVEENDEEYNPKKPIEEVMNLLKENSEEMNKISEKEEEKKLSQMMMTQTHRKLYNGMMHSKRKKKQESMKLLEKRIENHKKMKTE